MSVSDSRHEERIYQAAHVARQGMEEGRKEGKKVVSHGWRRVKNSWRRRVEKM